MTRVYVFGSKQNDSPCTKYKITKDKWAQFKATRLSNDWESKRIAAQERQRLNDTPHVLSRGGYALLEKKMRKRRPKELGLESTDLAPPPARHELWKAAQTKSNGQMTSQSAEEISQRIYEFLVEEDPPRVVAVGKQIARGQIIHGAPLLPTHVRVTIDDARDPQALVPVPTSEIQFVGEALGTLIVYRPEKQPMPQPMNEAHEEAKDDNDPLSILTSRLNKLRKGPIELQWQLRTFGLECHIPFVEIVDKGSTSLAKPYNLKELLVFDDDNIINNNMCCYVFFMCYMFIAFIFMII
ncbi:hypothetical protein LR48_Vigan08g084800 [Vigna angularis]|uniref:Uncharacterized protein n=1 Tax=Phaseolus angularis TaxID=3914 RepID=A0A0L9V4U8_PHAAN|nr:hypothetical protein LR48_Vigan08g084800 [Vigna angularis]